MQKKFSLKKNRLAKTIIISGSILIIVAFVILRYEGFFEMLSKLLSIFRPVIIGGVIAFALNRPMNFMQVRYRKLLAWIKNSFRRNKHGEKVAMVSGRVPFVLAFITTYLLTIAVLVGIICFIIPQISDSITLFSENVNDYIENFEHFIESNKENFSKLLGEDFDISEIIDKVISKIKDEITNIMDYIPEVLSTTMDITSGIIGVVIDFVIGIVFSIYILLDKQNLKKGAKKIAHIVIKGERYAKFEKVISMAYDTFSNFISGQLLEAIILALLCFVGMSLFGFDYAPLISVIIGITNMIPIAGPIIGTIPGAVILLLVNPIDAVWFVVFVIVIQQIDSNLIYPKVVGNSVGLPPLLVLFAITVGGGFAGVMGMILGVPVLSIIYALVQEKLGEEETETK
ncbi:MAG: AI-2E family transporter [Porcipelethomonas sp.]